MAGTGKGGRPPGEESVRIFQNDILEALTHMHPATPWFVGVPTFAFMLWWAFGPGGAALLPFLGLLLVGLLGWTLLEYMIHRFAFHYRPRTRWGRFVHFLAHGVHHDYPNDASRLVMPPVLSIPIGIGVYSLLWWFIGIPAAPAVFSGMVAGYVTYDTVHYMAHHRPMRGPLGRAIKRYHMRHHFVDPDAGYGVSTPLWDYVFRTHPNRKGAGHVENPDPDPQATHHT